MIFRFFRWLVVGLFFKVTGFLLASAILIYFIFLRNIYPLSNIGSWWGSIKAPTIEVQVSSKDFEKNYTVFSPQIKQQIDQWIISQNLNQYGDKLSTVYAGGTPLYNETTGQIVDRYQYIISKHPELLKELSN